MKNLLTAFLLVLVQSFSSAQDINISNYAYFDSEPAIAINPTDAFNLVAAWMSASSTYIQMKLSYSKDGGKTWSTPYAIGHTHAKYTSADPGLAFSKSGKVYFTYIDFEQNKDSGAIYMMNSADGGQNWSSPVKVLDGSAKPDKPIDRPWICVDNSGGTYDGRIYVCMKSVDVGSKPHHVWMRSTDDEGKTWSGLKLLDSIIPSDLIENNLAIPTVGPDGTLYTAYFSWHLKSSVYPRIICLRSKDGGTSFSSSIVDNFTASSATSDSLYQAGYTLAANPTDAGNIVISWVDNINGDPDIYSSFSSDSGKTWSKPVRVNDDTKGNGAGQDMVWGSFSPIGFYGLSWRDRRSTGKGSDAAFDLYSSVSRDGGNSFSPNFKLNSDSSKAIKLSKGNDFIGVCLDNDSIFANWAGLKGTFPDIYFNKKALPAFSGIQPEDKPREEVRVSPNPFSDELDITILKKPVDELVRVSLFDLNGRELYSKSYSVYRSGSLRLSFPGLARGKYILRVNCSLFNFKQKVEKM